jgi:hypothetical protein
MLRCHVRELLFSANEASVLDLTVLPGIFRLVKSRIVSRAQGLLTLALAITGALLP